MEHTGRVEMTYALLRGLNHAAFARRGILVLGSIEALSVVGIALATSPARSIGFAVVAIALVPLYEWAIWRSWARVRPLTREPWVYAVSASTVTVATPGSRVAVSWTKAWTTRRAWIFNVPGARGRIPVPRAAFPPEVQHQIDALIAAHVAGAAAAPVG